MLFVFYQTCFLLCLPSVSKCAAETLGGSNAVNLVDFMHPTAWMLIVWHTPMKWFAVTHMFCLLGWVRSCVLKVCWNRGWIQWLQASHSKRGWYHRYSWERWCEGYEASQWSCSHQGMFLLAISILSEIFWIALISCSCTETGCRSWRQNSWGPYPDWNN